MANGNTIISLVIFSFVISGFISTASIFETIGYVFKLTTPEYMEHVNDFKGDDPYECYVSDTNCTCMLKCITAMDIALEELISNKTYVKHFTIILDAYDWLGYYPNDLNVAFNITRIQEFSNLETLNILPTKNQHEQVDFIYNPYKPLTELYELRINVPIVSEDMALSNLATQVTKLRTLDIGNTRKVAYSSVSAMVSNMATEVKTLNLRLFQTFGEKGYQEILDPVMFHNDGVGFPQLEFLDVSFNGFQLVYAGWAKYLPNLKYLDISHNVLTVATNTPHMIEMFMHSNLQVFNFSYQGYEMGYNSSEYQVDALLLKDHYVKAERNQHVRIPEYDNEMNMVGNWSTKESKKNCPSKQQGFWSYSMIKCIREVTQGNVSEAFNCSSEAFCDFMKQCVTERWSNFSCKVLPCLADIYDPTCSFSVHLPFGPNLRYVSMVNNFLDPATHVGFIASEKLCLRNNSLETVIFSENPPWAQAENIAESFNSIFEYVGFDNFRNIDLSANDMPVVLGRFKINMPRLEKFNLSGNYLNVTKDSSICESVGFHQLREFDLSNANLLQFNITNIVQNCQYLQTALLSNNEFDSQLVLNLDKTPNLQFIDLRSNRISSINSVFAAQLDHAVRISQNLTLDIRNNPIDCGCQSLEFIKWLYETKVKIKSMDNITCTGRNGLTKLESIKYISLRNECWHITTIIIALAVGIGSTLLIVLPIAYYCNRWTLRYKLFKLKKKVRRMISKEVQHKYKEYEYDAFVSYSKEDKKWVHKILTKTLEDVYKFKVVIHKRDFEIGVTNLENITNFMTKSREMIVVISRNALRSNWCNFELNTAYDLAIKRGKSVIGIKLDNVNVEDIQATTVVKVLDRHYIEWNDSTDENWKGKKLFWSRLIDHLYEYENYWCWMGIGRPPMDYDEGDQPPSFETGNTLAPSLLEEAEASTSRDPQELPAHDLGVDHNCEEQGSDINIDENNGFDKDIEKQPLV